MRIFLAIDGSAPAEIGVDLVANIAWPAGSEILVAEVVESAVGLFGGPWPALPVPHAGELDADIRSEAERTVHEVRERLARPGWSVDAAVLSGRPATSIVHRASDMHADLIIVGSRGHGTIESMLLGSVSAEVIDHAAVPVLVARKSRIERIILAWDGSPTSLHAADLLHDWPIFAGSSVRVVSVAGIGVPWWTGFPEPGSPELMSIYVEASEGVRLRNGQLASDMTAQVRAEGLDAVADPREGDVAAQILAAASAFKADLIVMGTHGRTGLTRLVLGSVARNVVHHAVASVLVVRGGPPAATEPRLSGSNGGDR